MQEERIKKEHEEFIKKEINGETAVANEEGIIKFEKINKICEALKEELVKLN
jgi:uncharacterized protein (UPF0218 family)